tara:strand:- start:969 stop:1139 length:171 start_codon:yes stop_codon:yes gene_type:complete
MNFDTLKLNPKHKEGYKDWFVDMVSVIETELQIKLTDGDFKYLLDIYFNQLKEGGN